MKAACRYGDLSVVQWLAENHLGPRICDGYTRMRGYSNELVEIAAGEGHIDVLEYLCSYPLTQDYDNALDAAVRKNHLDSVKCLLKHISYTATDPEYMDSVVALAAYYGRLEIVQYLHRLESLAEIEGFDETKVKILLKDAWWSRADSAMNDAARGGHLSVVKWLHEHDSTKWFRVMDSALFGGHLELAQWLHKHRPEQCAAAAMDKAVSEGRLEMVKWLNSNGVGACTPDAMDQAAANGHLHMIKWLHANQSMGFTVNTLSEAVTNDHLHVACWVYRPEHARQFIQYSDARLVMPRTFEMVLFMQTHLPWFLTPGAVKHIKKSLLADEMHLRGWLTENYPESA
ncbi:hypothetical protein PF003_g34884 [Phytophthora fragariae]|nr:hypothetical protein PF003_g34884 [Phytophthora fragariae]